MRKEDCYYLGYIAKCIGYKGDVSFFLDVTDPNEYQTLDAVFVEVSEGSLIPFFIQNIRIDQHKAFAKVHFEDVDDEQTAKSLVRKSLYLPLASLPKLSGTHFYDHEIIGFTIVDEEKGEIGKIEKILDYPQNPLFEINAGGSEVLFPVNQEFFIDLDRENKILTVSAPDGFFDVYDI